MPRVSALFAARHASSLAVLALTCLGVAGCSSDTSRFGDSPFSSPFASKPSQEVTGSVQRQPTQPVQSQPLAPVASAPQSYPAQAPTGGAGMGAYHSAQPAPVATTASAGTGSTWQSQGGISIIVGSSDTVDILAKRYNVAPAAILQANNMSSARMLQPGQRLVIPRSSVRTSAAPALAIPQTAPAATSGNSVHTVASGDTLMSLSRRYNVSLSQITQANSQLHGSQLKIGDKVVIPGRGAATAQSVKPAVPANAAPASSQVAAGATAAAQKVATAAPAQVQPQAQARLASAQTPVEDKAEPANAVKAAEATGGLPSFRWPVRGRVIAAFGAKTNGKSNDGINLSVPAGTPIKAAEDGVVAYAGSELKGYGNLVLVRHSSGYVTAYAHASEIAVKRGDTVKRGQMLGKAGQTGDVTSPQLHFEIRKGSTPVDPTQFLNGA